MWSWQLSERSAGELALDSAHLSLRKDVLYRQWAASHGGVYVPVTETTQPNPYLEAIPERDLVTPSGRRLTLLNPAYMTRQVQEMGLEGHGLYGHITSLMPLRPENAPDPWEEEALRKFEEGAAEVVAVSDVRGEPHLRLMQPFVTEQSCLKCHAVQGYDVGDIRGGISVSAPLRPYLEQIARQRLNLSVLDGMLWLAGLGAIWLLTLRLAAQRRAAEAEQRRQESAARERQKLEAVGTLASGIAHEINNPLNVILNFGQLLLDDAGAPRSVREHAVQIVDHAERVAGIVRSVLTFARGAPESVESIAPSDLLGLVASLSSTLLRKDGLALEVQVQPGLPAVRCRPQQIQQVLLNLVTNARDAVNQRFPAGSQDGRIILSAARVEEDGLDILRTTVSDTGAGIPPDAAPRIFEPFFTTKPRCEGTGLGLSISHGIVRDHHGRIWFESTLGQGTSFHVDLPYTAPAPSLPASPPAEQA
jgi:signal transduction histidine kinase